MESRLQGWEDNIRIDGKNIASANVEQPSWIAYYDQICVEMGTVLDYAELLVKKVRAETMKKVKTSWGADYTDSALQKVIDGSEGFIYQQQIYLEVKELYDKCKSIVEAFKQRSYSLNNLVKIHEAEFQNLTIRL